MIATKGDFRDISRKQAVLFVFVFSLASNASAGNKDEGLVKEATPLFAPRPPVMTARQDHG
ncbi:MAG: hypothetical protein ABSA46_06630 [Thermodesulfovibrionales bacterium]